MKCTVILECSFQERFEVEASSDEEAIDIARRQLGEVQIDGAVQHEDGTELYFSRALKVRDWK
jgi:hypothetical protein